MTHAARFPRPSAAILLLLLVAAGCASTRYARRAETIGVRFVSIPGARYLMGDTFEGTNSDALPVHAVSVAPFALAATETTLGQYRTFVAATGRDWEDPGTSVPDDIAVSGIDWDDAVAFCVWLGARLPSEQEWEFAAAGGSVKQLYPGTDDADSVSVFVRHRGNSVASAGQVGRKRANRFGLHDMGGNVAEWIGAFYQFYPKAGTSPVYDDPASTGIRIVRGGSFSMEPEIARTYWRAGTLREVTSPAIGFRCAK